MIEPAELPKQLARFPAPVHDAFRHYQSTGDSAAVQTIVQAALVDFLPQKSDRGTATEADARLIEDLGYDSLAIAELVFFFEDLFKITISSREIREVRTVGELRQFVDRKLAESRRPA